MKNIVVGSGIAAAALGSLAMPIQAASADGKVGVTESAKPVECATNGEHIKKAVFITRAATKDSDGKADRSYMKRSDASDKKHMTERNYMKRSDTSAAATKHSDIKIESDADMIKHSDPRCDTQMHKGNGNGYDLKDKKKV